MKKELKVLTITLNPALDLTGSLDTLVKGEVNLLKTATLQPGGKGINVAKVLCELGASVTVMGFLGKENQQPFIDLFEQLNVTDRFIRVNGATRINVKIVEKSGQTSDLNFPGIEVTEQQQQELTQTLCKLMHSFDLFVIAGSLPQGVDPAFYSKLIKQLNKAGKKVFFDSSNIALEAGINAGPYLIKPNEDELNALFGKKLSTDHEIKETVYSLHQQCENVVISQGEKGVLWLDKTGWLKSTPPKMQIISTVGAGDTLVAGLCWGALNRWDKAETLSFATALSALAVSQVGVGGADLSELTELQKKVQLN